MPFSLKQQFERIPWVQIAGWSLLILLVISVLWRGGKSLEMTWLLTAVAWICAFAYFYRRPAVKISTVHPVLWVSTIALIIWTVLSYKYSSTQNYGLDEVLRTGALGILFLWTMRTVHEGRKGRFADILLWTIAMTTLIACAIGLAVYILQPVNRFVGTFFDARFHTDYWPNAWAEYLLLAWPAVAWWVTRKGFVTENMKMRFPRAATFLPHFVLGLVFGTLLLSYSRATMIAFGGQIVLWALFLFLRSKDPDQWKEYVTTGVITLLIAAGAFSIANGMRTSLFEVQSVTEKVTFTADEGSSSVSERQQFWDQAITLTFQRPKYGWGPYSFRFIQPRMQDGILETSDHPHNVFLKFAMERGVMAAGLLALIIGTVFLSALWRTKKAKVLLFDSRFAILLAVAGVLAHNMVDYNLQFVGIAFPFWLFLGVLGAEIAFDKGKKLINIFVRTVEVLLISALLITAVIEARYLILSSLGRHAEDRGAPEQALVWYDMAKSEWLSRDIHLSRAKILFELQRYDEGKTALDDYFILNGEDGRAWKRKGDFALAEKRYHDALVDYQNADYLNGFNDLSILHGLMQTYLAMNLQEEIDAQREEFDAILDAADKAFKYNVHYIALSPNVEEFIAITKIFEELYNYREDPRYQVLGARAEHHARIERERISSRPPGYLW